MMKNLISWFTRITGIDFSFFLKNSAWVTLNQSVSFVTGIAISVVFAQYAAKSTYGQYTFLFSLLGLFSMFSIPGLSGVVFRAVAKGYDGTYLPAVKHSLMMGVFSIPVLLIIGGFYLYSGDIAMGISIFALAILFPFSYPFQLWNNLLQAREKFSHLAIFNSIVLIFNLMAIVLAIYYDANNVLLVFIASLLSTCLLNLLFFFRTLRYISNEKIEFGWKKSAYLLLLPLMFTQFYDYIDKIVLKFFMGDEILADYTIAVLPGDKFRYFLAAILIIYLPKLYRADTRFLIGLFKKKIIHLTLVLTIITIVLVMLLPFVIRILYSEKYETSIFPGQLYMMILPLYIITALSGNILIKEKAEKFFTTTIIVSSIANLAAYFILIPLIGLMGGVIGSLVYFVVQASMRLFYILRKFS